MSTPRRVAAAPLRSDLRAIASGIDDVDAALARPFQGNRYLPNGTTNYQALHAWASDNSRTARGLVPELKQRVERVTSTVGVLTAERDALEVRITEVAAELRTSAAEARARYDNDSRSHETLVAELGRRGARIADLERELRAATARADTLAQQKADAEADASAARATAGDLAARLAATTSELDTLRAAVADPDGGPQWDVDALRSARDRAAVERDAAQTTAETLRGERDEARAQLAATQADLAADRARVASLGRELVEARERCSSDVTALEAERDGLRTEAARLTAEMTRLTDELDSQSDGGMVPAIAGFLGGLVVGRGTKGERR